MGEPLLHHQIEKVLVRAGQQGFKVMITTNGTLLRERGHVLLAASAVERVSISLHSFEGSGGANLSEYLDGCLSFAQKIAETGKRCALRLWNLDGPDIQGNNRLNDIILAQLEKVFPKPWKQGRRGITMAHRSFWSWERSSTGPTCLPPIPTAPVSATACGTMWEYSGTEQLCPAVWIMRGIFRWETFINSHWKKY